MKNGRQNIVLSASVRDSCHISNEQSQRRASVHLTSDIPMATMRGGCSTLWLVFVFVNYLVFATAEDENSKESIPSENSAEIIPNDVTFSENTTTVNTRTTTHTIVYYTFTDDDPATRVIINRKTNVRYKKISTKVELDGSKVTIYLKKVRLRPDGSEEEIDWEDKSPTNVIRAVKEKITSSGQQTFLEFESDNTKEKVVTTMPGKDGIDVTIIRKKYKIGPDGREYEVDWDEEGVDIIVKNMERTKKPDGTISITEVFEPGKPRPPPPKQTQPSKYQLQNVQVQYIQTQPDGSKINMGVASQRAPNPAFLVQQPQVDPRFKVLNSKVMPKNGGTVIVYEVKVLLMPDGSEIITNPNDKSQYVRTRLFRKLIRSDGKIIVTEVAQEVPSETTLIRIEKIIKRRPDGTLVELDSDVDTEPNAELVTRIVRTKKKSATGEIIEVEDDIVELTRKVYTHTTKGIFVTEYKGGLVVKQYKSDEGLSFKATNTTSTNANPKDLSSFGGGIREGLKGSLGLTTVAGDLMGGMLGVGTISNKKNIADDLMDVGVEGIGTVADIPAGFVDQAAEMTGVGFITRPAAYTGGLILGAAGGGEAMKVKWGLDAFKLGNVALGVDSLLHRDVAPPEKTGSRSGSLGGFEIPNFNNFPGFGSPPGVGDGGVPAPGIPFMNMFGVKK